MERCTFYHKDTHQSAVERSLSTAQKRVLHEAALCLKPGFCEDFLKIL